MSRGEIRKQFDAIVDFAEVERFLDTPVKRYSSGMYVRLAFAVAAHLEPEILIVDEVLAVGDGEFQKKCLGKMGEVAAHGRTVLFVSHNMLAVQKLCPHAIMLKQGKIHCIGNTSDVVAEHTAGQPSNSYLATPESKAQILSVELLTESPRTDHAIDIAIEWFLPETIDGVKIGVGLNTSEGQRIFDCAPEDTRLMSPSGTGHHRAIFKIPANRLLSRTYVVSVGIWKHSTVFDHVIPALSFFVEAAPVGPYSHQSTRDGFVNMECNWEGLE